MSKPYNIIQRKIIIKHLTSDFCQIDDKLLSLIMSYVYESLIVKCTRDNMFRLIRIMNIDLSTYHQIQNEIHGLLGFNLLAIENGAFKTHEINSIGAYVQDFYLRIDKKKGEDISYEDFSLCDYESNDTFYISKINGCMYDAVMGFDILLILIKYLYGIKYVKISKKKIEKLKSKGTIVILV